ncbi:MAG: hypothetical protein J6S60_10190 [Oscillospiraceae bacterium]|nr:hypothetical protein [Oscillospiraceae bacterium]
MTDKARRGAVILIQRGDPEIAAALAGGLLAARARPLDREQAKVVEAEIDRQRIQAALRVAVGNAKGTEDYRCMMTKARYDYASPAGMSPLRRLGRGLLAVYGLVCYVVARAYHSQGRILGPSQMGRA